MAQYANIQFLFSQIAASQLSEYLKSRGWQRSPGEDSELARFAKQVVGDEAPLELAFFASETHPRFRYKIPDVIFRLCLIEERPALDIANEIYDLGRARAVAAPSSGVAGGTSETPAPHSSSTVARWTFQHGRVERLNVHIKSRGEAYALDAGDRLTVVCRAEDSAGLEILFNDLDVVIQCAAGIPLRLVQTAPTDRPALRDVIRRELATLRHHDGSPYTEESIANLTDLLRRIDFELGPADGIDPQSAAAYRRQAAVLAVTLARSLPATRLGRLALWRCVQRLCAGGQLGFELYPTAADDLAIIAAGDDPIAPVPTLDWLKSHAIDRATAAL